MTEFNFEKAFKANEKVGRYGIKYLDDELHGINKGDLVLIGARAGAGKTTLSRQIAMTNKPTKAGEPNVALFSLENFTGDFELNAMWHKWIKKNKPISLRQFISGDFCDGSFKEESQRNDILRKIEKEVKEEMKGLTVYNREDRFTVNTLAEKMNEEAHKGTKLIILDHLDYFDKDDERESDVEHMSYLMHSIRKLQLQYKVAVVAISHLRKPSFQREKVFIPSMDEFIGSSNKVKESTAVVMFAPDDETNQANVEKGIYDAKSTWCCIRKNRFGGITNTAGQLFFDTSMEKYIDEYNKFSINYAGTEAKLIHNCFED